MPLSLNEIRSNALAFSKEWETETSERAEAKTFWDAFFRVFGITRRRVASFEAAVSLVDSQRGFIDLFWKGLLLVEHKSRGASLDTAYKQALDYFPGIDEVDLPRYVLVSDFARFRLHDLEEESPPVEFALAELHQHVHRFGFMLGHNQRLHIEEPPANIGAAKLMAGLHDVLKADGYSGHRLEMFLVRLLFCFFADDTGIFAKDALRFYLEEKTRPDGTDLGLHLSAIFDVLDTEPGQRQSSLSDDLLQFPYVNGTLFKERLRPPAFNENGRRVLIECAKYNWSKVSPAVFGSLFQVAMDPLQRHYLGAHYTSEANILKALGPLFLDGLAADIERHKNDKRQLGGLLAKIARLRILDPACGCGTFLIVAYRELRLLELSILAHLKRIQGGQEAFSVDFTKTINVDALYGIEVEELPVRIAETALWVVDHQLNIEASERFGQYFTRLPLVTAPHIVQGDALELKWADVIQPDKLSYIVGNPPFAGKKRRTKKQNEQHKQVCADIRGAGVLDLVACWFIKSEEYTRGTNIGVALVATNSIVQGEQVGILWGHLLSKGVHLNFAHRTFEWTSDAGQAAHVHVVIVGFSHESVAGKRIFDYHTPTGLATEVAASQISPYLVDGPTVLLEKRRASVSGAPKISFGSMPNDGGHLLLTPEQMRELVTNEPQARKWVRPLLSASEHLGGHGRYCLWLEGITPSELDALPLVRSRVEGVKRHRLDSTRDATRSLASTPALFAERRQPKRKYIWIPRHSSEQRRYVPMTMEPQTNIVSDSCVWVDGSDAYTFGVLMSSMHMAWVRHVCGRIKSDFRYSNELVYNNYPWPSGVSNERVAKVADAAEGVLKVREDFTGEPLDKLYDPILMPSDLAKAHDKLDRAVERAYRPAPFATDLARVQFLFSEYQRQSAPLAPVKTPRRKKRTP